MRIGIDCRTILSDQARYKAGVAHYTYYLVKHLLEIDKENEYILFWPSTRPAAGGASSGSKEFYSLSERRRVEGLPRLQIQKFRYETYKKFLPYVYSHILVANQIKQARLDVFHSPANIIPLTLFRGRGRPKTVVTVHDLAIYRHPEWFPAGQGFSVKHLVPKTIAKVDHIIAPSAATKKDIVELFKVREEKITVIPHGVEQRFFGSDERLASSDQGELVANRQSPIANRYILFVGTIEPRKNLSRLIEAYSQLPPDILEKYDLIIAGQKGWKYQEVLKAISDLQPAIRDRIKLLGHYPGEDLPALLQGAAVFVYPSLYEGFGLPVLEAMAAGVPVVAGDTTSLRELLEAPEPGDSSAGLLVDPYSPDAIGHAVRRCIRDTAFVRQISQAGLRSARLLTWEKTAAETLRVYNNLGA